MAAVCKRHHGHVTNPQTEPKSTKADKPSRKVTDADVDKIVNRLHRTPTKSSIGCPQEVAQSCVAKDVISKKGPTDWDVQIASARLYKTPTKAMIIAVQGVPARKDDKAKVSEEQLTTIVERLHTTHTTSSGGGGPQQVICTNSIAREAAQEEELQEIFQRLCKSHTKASSGGPDCKQYEPISPPGYGQKMYPAIEGLETRFAGDSAVVEEEVKAVAQRLTSKQTTASQARLDNPRILLYPERTILMNNVERIRSFQENGNVAKQTVLARREKWYN